MNPMKDSGVEWIGEIPESWTLSKFKYEVATPITDGPHETPELFDEGIPFVSAESVKNGRINLNLMRGYISEKDHLVYSRKVTPQRDDIFIVKSGAGTGQSGIVDVDDVFDIWSPLALVRMSKRYSQKFTFYFIQSRSFSDQVENSWSFGTQQNIGMSVIERLYLTTPPIKEQQAIANFLDEETKKLDDAKDLLQKQIEKLKAYRTSLIWETVTKGLDKSVPMKDSGVEWIGEIPEDWEVKKIKYVSSSDDEQVKTQDISFGKIIRYVDIGSVNLTEGITGYQEMSLLDAPSRARKIVRIGDTIVSTVRTYLKAITYIQDEENVVVSTGFSVLRPKQVDRKYFNYCIISDSFTKQVENVAWGIAYPSISNSNLMNLKISYPADVLEQQAIADFLDEKTSIVENIISNIQSQIEVIDKQKKTLIYDYVTGKRRVI